MIYNKLSSIYNNLYNFIDDIDLLIKNLKTLSQSFNYYSYLPYTKKEILEIIDLVIKNENRIDISAEINYQIGIIMLYLNKLKYARKFLRNSIKLDNKNENYYLALSLVYEKMYKADLMLKYYEKAEHINSFNVDVIIMKGRLMESQNNIKQAHYYYNLANDIEPDNPQPYFFKGKIYFLEEEYEDAIKELEKASKYLDEDDYRDVDVLTLLAECKFENKEYNSSFDLFDFLFDKYPYRCEHYYAKSELVFSLGKESDALILIDKAIEYAPNNSMLNTFYIKKADFLNLLSRTDEAIYYIEKSLKIYPYDIKVLDMYGEILSARSEYEKSTGIYLQRNSIVESSYVYYHIANNYFSQGNYAKSYEYVNKFIHLENDYPQAYILRAKINSIQGYRLLSINDLNKALSIDDEIIILNENDLFYFSNLKGMEEFQHFLDAIENRFNK